MHTFSKNHIAEDWRTCKRAHTDATEMWELQGKWAPETVQPWLDHLAEMARAFKSVHGIEFDPRKPISDSTEGRAA